MEPTFGHQFKTGLAAVSAAALLSIAMSGQALAQSQGGAQPVLPEDPPAAGYGGQGPAASDLRYSWLPYTTSGYVGISVGKGELHTSCVAGLSCEDPDTSGKVYTGGMFNPYLGIELGYIQWGDAEHNGGKQKARGVNAMLTGFVPLGPMFTLVGKVGTTYGWTKSAPAVGVVAPAGSADAFALAYGAGVSFDFTRNWSVTLDWERHKLKFQNEGRKDVDLATLGVKYRF